MFKRRLSYPLVAAIMAFIAIAIMPVSAQKELKIDFRANLINDKAGLEMQWYMMYEYHNGNDLDEMESVEVFLADGEYGRIDNSHFEKAFEYEFDYNAPKDSLNENGMKAFMFSQSFSYDFSDFGDVITVICRYYYDNDKSYDSYPQLVYLNPPPFEDQFYITVDQYEEMKGDLHMEFFMEEEAFPYMTFSILAAEGYENGNDDLDFEVVVNGSFDDCEEISGEYGNTDEFSYRHFIYNIDLSGYTDAEMVTIMVKAQASGVEIESNNYAYMNNYHHKPNPEFIAQPFGFNEDGTYKFGFAWYVPAGYQYDKVKVHMAGGAQDELNDNFEVVLDELFANMEDTTAYYGDDMVYYTIVDLDIKGNDKMVTFFSEAYNSNGSDVKGPVFAEFHDWRPQDELTIDSKPEPRAKIGEEYTYQVVANYDGDLVEDPTYSYSIQGPEGMTISETGLITWTPTERGSYSVSIIVELNDSYLCVDQYFNLEVYECETPATLSGTLEFGDNTKFGCGYLMLLGIDYQDGEIVPNYGQIIEIYFDEEEENFKFDYELDAGDYLLYYEGYPMGEWYEDAYTVEDATVITLECGESKEITWKVADEQDINYYTVTGTVRDENGDGLVGANVEFTAYGSDDHWGGKYYQHYSVTTDENGNYTVDLPEIMGFIGMAYYGHRNYNSDAYLPQYYDHVEDPVDAEIIRLSADRSGVDFDLTKYEKEDPNTDYSISGLVVNSDSEPLTNVFVVAFMNGLDANGQGYDGFAQQVNDEGRFGIENIPGGEYILFAFPMDQTYVPGFYREGETAALSWEEATVLILNIDEPNAEATIILPEFEETPGICGYTGKVKGRPVYYSGDAQPLNGASVYLLNSNSNVAQYTKTDAQGNFDLDNLEAGQYTLVVDKVGYTNVQQTITLNLNGSEDDKSNDVIMNPEGTVGVNDDIVTGPATTHPNPATDETTVSFRTESSSVQIEVLAANGSKVFAEIISTVPGMNNFKYDTRQLSSGLYFVVIGSGADQQIVPFVVSR